MAKTSDTIVKQHGRLRYIEPNDIPKSHKRGDTVNADNFLWYQEDYNMFADLQVITPDRTRTISIGNNISIQTVNKKSPVKEYVSLMQGKKGKGYLTDDYINASYSELTSHKNSSTENLGISGINVRFDDHFYPQVTITFVDVRGYSLMMPSEYAQYQDDNFVSLLNGLFHYPYPRFLLTLRGHYGTKVTFQLAVNEFYSALNSSTGNFEITVNFIGYMYGLYSDIPMNMLLAAPYYGCNDTNTTCKYWADKVDDGTFTFDNGLPIMNFLEYIRATYDINKKIANDELGKINIELSALDEVVSAANNLKAQFNGFCNSMLDNIKIYDTEIKPDFIDAGERYYVYYFGVFESIGEASYMIEKVRQFNNAIDVFNATSSEVKIKELSNKIYFNYQTGGKKLETIKVYDGYNTNNVKLSDINLTIKDAFSFCVFDTKLIRDQIESAITAANAVKEKYEADNSEKLAETMKTALVDALGFKPSVENIYRMIFAHLDCFIHLLYNECIDNIMEDSSKAKRTLDILSNFFNDIPTKYKHDFIPPFTNVFRRTEQDNHNVHELLWIGSEENMKDFEEVKFIEKLFAGVIALKRSANEVFVAEKVDEENEGVMYTWCPTMITDILYEQNPYSYLTADFAKFNSTTTEGQLGHMLSFAEKRLLAIKQSSKYGSDEDDLFNAIKVEANNFVKAFPRIPLYLKNFFKENKKGETDEVIKNARKHFANDNIFSGARLYFTTLDKKEEDVLAKNEYTYESAKAKSGHFVIYDSEKANAFEKAWKNLPEGIEFGENTEKQVITDSSSIVYMLGGGYGFTGNTLWDGNKAVEKDNYNTAMKQAITEASTAITNPKYHFPFFKVKSGDTYVDLCTKINMYKNDKEKQLVNIAAVLGPNDKISEDKYSNIRAVSLATLLWASSYIRIWQDKDKDKEFKTDNFSDSRNRPYLPTTSEPTGLVNIFKELKSNEQINTMINIVSSNFYTDNSKNKMTTKVSQAAVEIFGTPVYLAHYYTKIGVTLDENDLNNFLGELGILYGVYTTTNAVDTDMSEVSSKDITNSHRLAAYESIKTLYDKWLCGYDKHAFELRGYDEALQVHRKRFFSDETYDPVDAANTTEFDNFIFIDSFYRDISEKYFINPKTVYDILKNHIEANFNYTVYQFMNAVAQYNKLIFLSLPVYNNLYSVKRLQDIFTPQPADKEAVGMGTTYVLMYPHEVSHFANDKTMDRYAGFKDDGIDLSDTLGNPKQTQLFLQDTNGLSYTIPAFGVTYAKQNQSYFKNINVDMNNPKVTDFSIANTFELGNVNQFGGATNVQMVGQDLYSIFSNRSYRCTVDMMGCMNIMPMMYFQLNNVPMVKGAYVINEVEHNIRPGDVTTRFSGIRVSKNVMPYNKDMFNFKAFSELVKKTGNRAVITSPNGSTIAADATKVANAVNYAGTMQNGDITLLNVNNKNMNKRKRNIEYIILHYTAGASSKGGSWQTTYQTLIKRGFSSDFMVDDENIVQWADDPAEYCSKAVQRWSKKGTEAGRNASNQNAVSIEICSTIVDWDGKKQPPANSGHYIFTDKVLAQTAKLCRSLMKTYNIPKDHVIRHFDIMGKLCPGVLGWNTGKNSPNDDLYRSFVNSL